MKKFDVAMLTAFLLVVLAIALLLTSLHILTVIGASICGVLSYAIIYFTTK